MESGEYSAPPSPGLVMAESWQATLVLGVPTLILGIVVSFHPTGSLNFVAVADRHPPDPLGNLPPDPRIRPRRIAPGMAGPGRLLFIVIGVVLIRHLHLTVALIGLFVGITWIVQGVTALIGGIAGGAREGRGWWIAFGAVSLIAGIVVAATPTSSLTVLAALLGIWFIIMGIFEIIGGLMLRRLVRTQPTAPTGSASSAVTTG